MGSIAREREASRPSHRQFARSTALTHGLTLVTRNVDDFLYPDLEIIDPWETEGM